MTHPETLEQRKIVKLYRDNGCFVVIFAQGRKTRQTPGVPDLKVYHPKDLTWWHEVKMGDRRPTPAQCMFQGYAEGCGETYIVGDISAATQQLCDVA